MTPQDRASGLSSMIDKFNLAVEQQAQQLLSDYAEPHLARLAEDLRPFGITHAPMVWLTGVWEDVEGKLPPRVVGELSLFCGRHSIKHTFEIAVGSFHSATKKERIFELCMLRAEANMELEGHGDGHVLDRMNGLAAELGI